MWHAEATTYNWEVNVFPEGLTNRERDIDAHLIDGDVRQLMRQAFAYICQEIEEDVLVLTMPGEFEDNLDQLLQTGSLPIVEVQPTHGVPWAIAEVQP